ncbi:UDP-N-acetylmuramoyl-tripeptide--D-alanyl-D-alanine ligase [Sphingomicrobium astaxanthinifaciens]|uniref:UDP-N-acetylmuramoyl-tripeptide--D-alanyl-D- alanine ligase n=1 Tax=Sphingomicrobium astaxanthinifaciens TaxID=1227949 RepID=UPI001FCBC3F4|nr:UDP-N-acetylmuramoyl-tripeptide--D-alanyl-D-alanine ligase [Sphingomicrobium astaxanthinifaciens]MCJ7421635.1 UDP-N-acetylmuramoyl-tripeptide--D-alanyl-D-alanine ligase [Sphingomicrobium astaxanthinifaciens]
MSRPLWTAEEIVAATGGRASADFAVRGVAFDSREIEPGFLFVAMPGTVHDGHDFVAGAFALGAAAALVARPVEGPHVLVDDVPAALDALARAARARLASDALVIGVTGSVGKTSTKEAIAAAFERLHPGRVHRSVKSYNNHTGVPLSLARMPREARVVVQEMGMNHAGEIAQLTRLTRPHIAVVTAIAPAHIENLGSIEAIADAKGEIFEGLEPGGTAIIPEATDQRERLVRAARDKAARILTVGGTEGDAAVLHSAPAQASGSLVTARVPGRTITFTVAQRGAHWVQNALTVLSVVAVAGGDVARAALALTEMGGLKGRGERHLLAHEGGEVLLIDESYNANPASMDATLKALGEEKVARKVAVLGTMKELGAASAQAHADLRAPIEAAGVELAILVGAEMAPLAEALALTPIEVVHVNDAAAATDELLTAMRPGDAVLVKASNSMGLGKLVEKVAGGGASCST